MAELFTAVKHGNYETGHAEDGECENDVEVSHPLIALMIEVDVTIESTILVVISCVRRCGCLCGHIIWFALIIFIDFRR